MTNRSVDVNVLPDGLVQSLRKKPQKPKNVNAERVNIDTYRREFPVWNSGRNWFRAAHVDVTKNSNIERRTSNDLRIFSGISSEISLSNRFYPATSCIKSITRFGEF